MSFVSHFFLFVGSLYVHNPDINVTVHSINGPVVATKVSLRCKECHTNYNHTWYGNQRCGGEQLYSEAAPLVEITDITYTQRSLQQWFLCLR